jgi:hypothetical protein
MKQLILAFSAALLTIISILANFSAYSQGTLPNGFGIIMTFLFLIGWVVLIILSIKFYCSWTLLFYGLFWLLSFITTAAVCLILAYGAPQPDWLRTADLIFVSPMFGLRDFLSTYVTLFTAGGVSAFFSILCLLCVRRKSDSRYVNRKKKKEVSENEG